jgi:hypothetical protein
MDHIDRAVLIVCLFGGFLWLRNRARRFDLGKRQNIVVFGIFLLLPAVLVGEKQLFDLLHFGKYTNLLIIAASLTATFAAIGYGFLRPTPADREGEPGNAGAQTDRSSG